MLVTAKVTESPYASGSPARTYIQETDIAEPQSQPRRYEAFALSAFVVAVLLGAAAVGSVLTPEQSLWENLSPGVVIALGSLLAYPFLKRRQQKR
jgi:predicted MFS family arabinose efflux permease